MTPATLDIPTLARTVDSFTFIARYLAWATRTATQRELSYGYRVRFVRGQWQVDSPGVDTCPVTTRGDAGRIHDFAFRDMLRKTRDHRKAALLIRSLACLTAAQRKADNSILLREIEIAESRAQMLEIRGDEPGSNFRDWLREWLYI